MTRLQTFDLPNWHRQTVGFDRLFNEIERQFSNSQATGYPPYNIEQIEDDKYMISVAVAGFTMEDLDITQEGNNLTISGNKPELSDRLYLHKGIANRNFLREFTLADHVEVDEASLDLGMLNISLFRNVPEALQPKKIAIKTVK